MSYDVWIGGWDGNMTSNHNKMWTEAFQWPGDGRGLHPLKGSPAVEAGSVIARAAARMRADPKHYDDIARECKAYFYDPPWCIPELAVEFLEEMAAACAANPDAVFEIHA